MMHTSALASSVSWDLSGDPCPTMEKAFSRLKNNTDAFIICNRGDDFLQATCEGPDEYYCEISFANGKTRELYATPGNLTYAQLHDLFSRYAGGEDLSFLKQEWVQDVEKKARITLTHVIVVILLLAAAAIAIPYFSK